MFSESGHVDFLTQLVEDASIGLDKKTIKEKIEIQLEHTQKYAFNPNSILDHEKKQLLKRTDHKDFIHEWEKLETRITKAEKALNSSDIYAIAANFYYLGLISAQLDQEKIDPAEMRSLLISAKTRAINNFPLERKAEILNFIQTTAVDYAYHYWQSSEHSSVRIGKMAQLTKDFITDVFSNNEAFSDFPIYGVTIPSDLNTYKKWLRPIAPTSAQKRGAPKKN